MTHDELEPTIVSGSAASAAGASADVSRADVGFVVGSRPKFADETADLLRRRLTAATLALGAALTAALLGSVIIGASSLWWIRTTILVVSWRIYALGAVAYYLLTGKPPFSGMNVIDLLSAQADGEVVPPSTVNVEIPGDLERVVLRCLEKNPAARFPDAASLGEALDACECAADWTNVAAAGWWAQNQETKNQTDRTENQAIDVTADFERDDAAID